MVFSKLVTLANLLKVKPGTSSRKALFKMASSGRANLPAASFYFGATGQKMPGGRDEFLQELSQNVRRSRETRTAEREAKKSLVLLGENHQDAAAHRLELEVLQRLWRDLEPTGDRLALSLEFYERDVQPVLNEYLGGHADLDTFLNDSRPPGNYADYQPLIDFCKESRIPVVASNCPRRYTRTVSRQGLPRLESLVKTDEAFYTRSKHSPLPPFPYRRASDAYGSKFFEIMGLVASSQPSEKLQRMLEAQTLWDASMAHSIAEAWKSGLADVIVHVSGYFHIQYGLGIGEHLPEYYDKDKYSSYSVVMMPTEPSDLDNEVDDVVNDDRPEDDENGLRFDEAEHLGLADVVVLSQT